MKHLAITLLLGLLYGCATEWRTGEIVAPSTYEAPSYRSASSIGRLSRLGVLPVMLHMTGGNDELSQQAWDARRTEISHEVQRAVVEFLVTLKGYDAREVEVSIATTNTDAVRMAGNSLSVDGIVLVERWFKRPWSTVDGLMNIVTLNIPLFLGLSKLNQRLSIYETASGRLVWQKELQGENWGNDYAYLCYSDSSRCIDLNGLLGDLENAVPLQLRR
jgi:hypothetical protein